MRQCLVGPAYSKMMMGAKNLKVLNDDHKASEYAGLKPNTQRRRRRRCVLNSQLVGDSLDESEQFTDNEVELRRVGGVNAPVVSRDPVSNFL